MALVDFHQLVVLFKLTQGDVGVTSSSSRPPHMPASKKSRSRVFFSLPEPRVTRSRSALKNATLYGRGSTPLSTGASIMQKQELDPHLAGKYNSDDYRKFILEDFERHRVFVSIEDFMKSVLHVPDDWKTQWGPTIEEIKTDRTFRFCHETYTDLCNTPGCRESLFYKPLVDMVNAILGVTSKSPLEIIRPRTPQRYMVNDPKRIMCGILNEGNLSPDIIAVHENLPLPPKKKNVKKRPKRKGTGKQSKQDVVGKQPSNMTWSHPLQVLEVKPFDASLIDGSSMPRLSRNGKDPRVEHAKPPKKSRHPGKKPPAALGPQESPSTPAPRKRPADEPSGSGRKTPKQHHLSTPAGAEAKGKGQSQTPAHSPQEEDTSRQMEASVQVGKYLLEQFSIPGFRSHATIGLVDRDRIQFYHANHSVILVSSAIAFGGADTSDGLDKLIAIVIAFSLLSLRDNGILHNLLDGNLFHGNEDLVISAISPNVAQIQEGKQLQFEVDGATEPFTLTFGELISREPSLVGRSTAVLHATSPQFENTHLIVKISWPGVGSVSETEFLKKAIEEANATEDQWALKHLPRLVFDREVVFDSNSTPGMVETLFAYPKFFSEYYKYEGRILRIIVQERLYRLTDLTNVKDIAQVLLDIACIHRWLYEKVGILHRDISLSNIMYRIIDGKVYGVLTDFDLSSWTANLTKDYTKTSQQRTGTPPYMAHGLLKGTDAIHLYRHDVESIFYVILILVTHYGIEVPRGKAIGGLRRRKEFKVLPLQHWFDQPSYKMLGDSKRSFLTEGDPFDVSPVFEAFRKWLVDLRYAFGDGIHAKREHERSVARHKGRQSGSKAVPPFDDDTFGGHISYSMLIGPARKLKGKLRGLIIRYESESA